MRSQHNAQPVGIVILVTLGAILGIFTFLGGASVFGFGAFVTSSPGLLGALFSVIGFAVLVVGILEVVVAYGAWLLRGWSWTLGVPVSLASIGINVLWVVAGASIGFGLIGTLAALAILYCLDASAVRAALGHRSPSLVSGVIRRQAEAPKAHSRMIRRPIRSSDDN